MPDPLATTKPSFDSEPGGSLSRARRRLPASARGQTQREGIALLAGIVLLMWIIEVINTIDSNRLDTDGIKARSFRHLWGIFTAPFIHGSFQHLIDNTIPLVFMGLFIALVGAVRLAKVTLIVIVIGGLGTWLISASGSYTFGASGLVFGYATFLFARGFFDRSALELLIGLVVGVVWGGALVSSLVPRAGVSWQGHLCGGIAGVIAALLLRRERPSAGRAGLGRRPAAGALAK
ncbi:MAG: rhomboid family intramembrane serine protease [Solirubrobacterales bacterium]|nr:rhomboid family intramembrane serine protease [Solirubrobacterales bacterium]